MPIWKKQCNCSAKTKYLKNGGFEENSCKGKNHYNRSSFFSQNALFKIKIIILHKRIISSLLLSLSSTTLILLIPSSEIYFQ